MTSTRNQHILATLDAALEVAHEARNRSSTAWSDSTRTPGNSDVQNTMVGRAIDAEANLAAMIDRLAVVARQAITLAVTAESLEPILEGESWWVAIPGSIALRRCNVVQMGRYSVTLQIWMSGSKGDESEVRRYRLLDLKFVERVFTVSAQLPSTQAELDRQILDWIEEHATEGTVIMHRDPHSHTEGFCVSIQSGDNLLSVDGASSIRSAVLEMCNRGSN